MVIGIDPSLNGTGIVVLDRKGSIAACYRLSKKEKTKNKVKFYRIEIWRLDPGKKGELAESHDIGEGHINSSRRIAVICSFVKRLALRLEPSWVMVEGYAYNKSKSQAGSAINLAELGGALRLTFELEETLRKKLVFASPSLGRKILTGKGNANKEGVWNFLKRQGIAFLGPEGKPNTDLSDAFAVANFAHLYRRALEPVLRDSIVEASCSDLDKLRLAAR